MDSDQQESQKEPEENLDVFIRRKIQRLKEELIKKQECLGPEFSKVLYDNLWDLYEVTEEKNNNAKPK